MAFKVETFHFIGVRYTCIFFIWRKMKIVVWNYYKILVTVRAGVKWSSWMNVWIPRLRVKPNSIVPRSSFPKSCIIKKGTCYFSKYFLLCLILQQAVPVNQQEISCGSGQGLMFGSWSVCYFETWAVEDLLPRCPWMSMKTRKPSSSRT
jgi:hypothetical protein